MNLKDKRVLVIGMAKSGISTVKTLWSLGAKITVNDIKTKEQLKDIILEIENLCENLILGQHPLKIDIYDLVILSPGVPTDLDFIKKIKKRNIPLMGELELAYRLSKGVYIGITGTNGKTTTTALTGEIFKHGKLKTYIVGNIGLPAVSKALSSDNNTVMVTEVSSFQLETIEKFRPKISAVLNITPDHLNRHKTMENYIEAKSNIFKNQRENDIVILNFDNDITRSLAKSTQCKVVFFSRKEKLDNGIYIDEGYITVKDDNIKERICKVEDVNIPGNHNLENALAATGIAFYYGLEKDIIKDALMLFKGVEHRIEFVDEIDGVKFINDSKGTNPDAAIKAIEAINAPIILIAGGLDKGSSFDAFIDSFENKVKKLILLGETSNQIKETAMKKGHKNISIVNSINDAVVIAFENSEKGDSILLSPACASWDMYTNFEERGKHFKDCVYKLRR